jgi:hypothetical protein
LSGGGSATGLSEKDDLKDFHLALAVQATSQQIAAYNLMLKSTDAAQASVQTFVGQLGKPNSSSEVASRGATVGQAIETARTENKKFLDAFSEQQKSGLKEIVKKLAKADSDLAQEAKALDLEVAGTKAAAPALASSAQNLDQALASFRSQQVGLGEEMSIGVSQDSAFNLPSVKNSLTLANQSIAIATSGVITRGTAEAGQNTFKLELTADLSDLQENMTAVLRADLDKADPCGERIEVQSATLTPRLQVSAAVVQLHFERWACRGRQTMNEMVEGNGTIEVKLTLAVGDDGSLRLQPEIGPVDAEGLVGELLRSGSLGETLRDKVATSVLSAARQGANFETMLPPAAQGSATLRRAQFQGTGSGRLLVVFEGDIRLSNEKAAALIAELTAELKGRSASQASSEQPLPETTPR